jgi:hypothetical protein
MTTPTLIQSLMIADEIRNEYPELARRVNGRLEAAVNMAAAGMVEDQVFYQTVRSESNPAGSYRVNLAEHSCTCPDHGRNGAAGIVCKHRLAAYICQQLTEREEKARREAEYIYPDDSSLIEIVWHGGEWIPCLVRVNRTADGSKILTYNLTAFRMFGRYGQTPAMIWTEKLTGRATNSKSFTPSELRTLSWQHVTDNPQPMPSRIDPAFGWYREAEIIL